MYKACFLFPSINILIYLMQLFIFFILQNNAIYSICISDAKVQKISKKRFAWLAWITSREGNSSSTIPSPIAPLQFSCTKPGAWELQNWHNAFFFARVNSVFRVQIPAILISFWSTTLSKRAFVRC